MGKNCNQQLEPSGVILGKSTRVLGKVVLTPEGSYDATRDYDYLCLVYDGFTKSSFISKKQVPAGTPLSNDEYWQPINNNSEVSTFSAQLRSLNNVGSPSRDSILVWDTTNNTFEWVDKPYSKAEVDNKFDDVQSTLDFDSTPTSGSLNPVTSEGIKNYVDSHTVDLSGKQDVIDDLETIRSNAENAYQKPVNGIPSTHMDASVQQALNKATTALQSTDMANYATQEQVSSAISSALDTALQNVVYAGDTTGSASSEGGGSGETPTGDYVTSAQLQQALASKADNANVAHLTGDETIEGTKIFHYEREPQTSGEGDAVEQEENQDAYVFISGQGVVCQNGEDFSWIIARNGDSDTWNAGVTLQSVLESLSARITALENLHNPI